MCVSRIYISQKFRVCDSDSHYSFSNFLSILASATESVETVNPSPPKIKKSVEAMNRPLLNAPKKKYSNIPSRKKTKAGKIASMARNENKSAGLNLLARLMISQRARKPCLQVVDFDSPSRCR